MDIVTLFFVFLAITVSGVIGAFINTMVLLNSKSKSIHKLVGFHMLLGLSVSLGTIGSIVTGILWLVQNNS